MAWEPTLYSLLGFLAAGVSAIVAVQVWRNWGERGTGPFLGLMIAVSGWSLAGAIQLGLTTAGDQLLWKLLGLAFGGTIPAFWFLFTIEYTGREQWLSRPVRAVIILEPLLFAALLFTNPVHGFVLENPGLETVGNTTVLAVSLGLGYYLHIVYAYLLITLGLALLMVVFVRNPTIYRTQTSLLMLGTIPPLLVNVAYTARLSLGPLPSIDLTPFAFVITGALFALALYQYDLLERTPVARERVLEEMGDGLLVLDTNGEIVDTNSITEEILSFASPKGHSITDVRFAEAETTEAALETVSGETVTETVGGQKQAYDIEWSVLSDHAGELLGHVVSFRNVTDRRRYEQRLEVTQRVLRHNLRNDVNVIRGYAELLLREGTDQQVNAARQILDTTDDLIAVSNKTQMIDRLDKVTEFDRITIDVRDGLETIVEQLEKEHPAATIECELPATLDVYIQDEDLFDIPVRNVLENAIDHAETDPWVRVRGKRVNDAVEICIEDSGPEIPEMELRVLEEGKEDPLQHGSGIGLWLVYWSVAIAGGAVQFSSREPHGNVVRMTFPAPQQSTSEIGVKGSL